VTFAHSFHKSAWIVLKIGRDVAGGSLFDILEGKFAQKKIEVVRLFSPKK